MRRWVSGWWILGAVLWVLLEQPPGAGAGGARDELIGGRILSPEEIASLLERRLQKEIQGGNKIAIRVREIQGYEKTILPPGALTWEMILPDPSRSAGSVSGTLILRMDGREMKRMRFQGRVELYADVVCTRGPLKRHQEVHEKDVERVTRNVTFLPPDIITEMGEVLGKRTTLSLNPREILRRSMIETPPTVKRGDRVNLLVETEQFKIIARGEVQEEGRRGERIKLINISSKKEVYGRVIDSLTVRVDF